jgi:hypothetical protein
MMMMMMMMMMRRRRRRQFTRKTQDFERAEQNSRFSLRSVAYDFLSRALDNVQVTLRRYVVDADGCSHAGRYDCHIK